METVEAGGLSEEDKEFIRKKLAEPKIFVNGRRRFKDEVRARWCQMRT